MLPQQWLWCKSSLQVSRLIFPLEDTWRGTVCDRIFTPTRFTSRLKLFLFPRAPIFFLFCSSGTDLTPRLSWNVVSADFSDTDEKNAHCIFRADSVVSLHYLFSCFGKWSAFTAVLHQVFFRYFRYCSFLLIFLEDLHLFASCYTI
jgi:hypothetical protein